MPTTEDRLSRLRSRQDEFTGIEFVQVVDKCDQTKLRVYFLTDTLELRPPFEDVGDAQVVPSPIVPGDIRIYSPRNEAPDVPVVVCPENLPNPGVLAWGEDVAAGRRYLEICVAQPGDFTDYRLLIDDTRIDASFNDVAFSFKVGCDDGLDCAEPLNECAVEPAVDFPVDYLARDFVSLRNALLDFAAQRYPKWQLPKEADVGVMFTEVLAALGDELSYVQDRVNREAYLETATERRSLRKKARLLDYEIHDGRMATTWIELTVSGASVVDSGWPIWARVEGKAPITFEIGRGMEASDENFTVDPLWNPGNFTLYCFDDDQACLDPGATEVVVRNDPANDDNPGGVVFDEAATLLWVGRTLLLRDAPSDPSEVQKLHIVTVTEVELGRDELFDIDIARIRWDDKDAPAFSIPLEELELSGNIVPATAGESRSDQFRLGPLEAGDESAGVIEAVEREGPLFSKRDPSLLARRDPCSESVEETAHRPPVYLLSLPGTDERGLAFADTNGDLRSTEPEIEVGPSGGPPNPWAFRRGLVGEGRDDETFTLEDGTWRRIVGYWRGEKEIVHRDYATGAGYSVRFGDGEFGRIPAAGSLFQVNYRLGSGVSANVPAGAVSALRVAREDPEPDVVSPLEGIVEAASNPFAVTDGVDPESATEIKMLTPEAYKAETLFAVRPEDYGTQAEKLDSVQRAQGTFRWTGSWLSAMTAVDPAESFSLSATRRAEVEAFLACRRQAGREVIVSDPKFVNLDLLITLCASSNAFPAQVRVRVSEALFGRRGARPLRGFFHPDNFTFGTPLRRSALEAAVQAVDGVDAVIGMGIRSHGVTEFSDFDALTFEVAGDQVIRLENSSLRPERGSLNLSFEGGA